MILSVIFLFLSFLVSAYTLLPICICLFFAIPSTNKLLNDGLIVSKNRNLIIKRYSASISLLLFTYMVIFSLIYCFLGMKFIKIYLLGGLLVFILGKLKGPLIFNKDNYDEYMQVAGKYIIEDKKDDIEKKLFSVSTPQSIEISEEVLDNLSKKIKKQSLDITTPNEFIKIFSNLSIMNDYSVSSIMTNNTNDTLKEEDVSFCSSMDKIKISNNVEAYFELLVFNFYIQIFFNGNEYGGRLILSNVDKDEIANTRHDNLSYTQEEKLLIKNINIPRSICFEKDGSIQLTVYETDASFEIRKVRYKINKNHHIEKIEENPIVQYKLLY